MTPGTYSRPAEPMPFTRPNLAPLALTHSAPLGPSTTWGMRSFSAAEAFLVNRSGGSQIRSTCPSAEMTSCFIGSFLPSSAGGLGWGGNGLRPQRFRPGQPRPGSQAVLSTGYAKGDGRPFLRMMATGEPAHRMTAAIVRAAMASTVLLTAACSFYMGEPTVPKTNFRASLNGSNEVPPTQSRGSGYFE